jgi:hypothetical protein
MSGKIQNLLQQASKEPNTSSVSFAKRNFTDEKQAAAFFPEVKVKLLNLENWNKNAGLSSFELFDENGTVKADKTIHKGDFNRISLKGSGKYDWVKIIDIYQGENEFVITVKPTYDPTGDNPDKTKVSHFFTREATNNFCLQKDDKSLALYVIGLGEKQNVSETENVIETTRNIAVANLGSYLGIQKGEWTTFCENFLSSENE